MPANYPPVHAGKELSGMGTPDLRGTQGTFTLFTDDPDEVSRDVSGGMIRKVNGPDLLVEGPPNPLRADHRVATATLTVRVDPEQPYARLQAGDSDVIIREGEWSDWIPLSFPLLPHLATAHGMVRVYAKQLHPHLQLYVSPVHSYDFPISQPKSFAKQIAEEIGPYNTLGIPEDTSALRQGVFNLDEFLSQTKLVLDDERRMLTYSLNHYEDGFLFFYFSSIDQNSHMLWGKHDDELLKFYRAIDACVGETRTRFPDADLMVMSDHGFTTFDRAVHLNRWLANHGLAAHAIGLNALYLKDRGAAAEVQSQLLAWRDPANGRSVVEAVEQVDPAKDNKAVAPDLIVGYARGYRASWQTGLGETPDLELEDNNDAWIADHCIDAAYVPGVLFTSWKNGPRARSLKDLSVIILGLFGARHTEN
jgi:hypothetical protein